MRSIVIGPCSLMDNTPAASFLDAHDLHLENMTIHLVIDTALLILIWLVQLIIYPVFKYMDEVSLKKWHRLYVPRITAIVGPLMVVQVVFSIVLFEYDRFYIIRLALLLAIWANTFIQAVPLHARIFSLQAKDLPDAIRRLLAVNWIRTWLWTMIWIYTILNMN